MSFCIHNRVVTYRWKLNVLGKKARNFNMLCHRSMALNCKVRKKFTHLQYDPILIFLARNCKRAATAAVAALVQKKKNRWTDTEEKILVELFGENEDKLRYKAFSSPEWLSIARQLHSRCKEQNVDSDKTPQQCKNKLANLTNFV